ncbi:MAG: DUF2334 domain-containing protein [Candidatus Stahlbacteria bacterium]|nr:MAG: DUF2334 domain-containing protein [Candidatus Stahlbacteria bacterium]
MKKLFVFVLMILIVMMNGISFAKDVGKSKPIVSFTFDDGHVSTVKEVLPIFKKYNIQGTSYIITEMVELYNDYYMNWNQIDTLFKNGWEIGAHTHTHPYLTKLTDEEIIFELDESIRCLKEHGFNPTSFAAPYGDFDNRVIKFVKERFQSHRTAWDVDYSVNTNGINLIDDPFYISAFELKGTTTVNEAKEMVDIAIKNKTWLVFFLHLIKTDGEIGRYEYSAEKLEEIVKYVVDKGVEVLPLSNALKIK